MTLTIRLSGRLRDSARHTGRLRDSARRGYTLLEVVLAVSISVVLLFGLYLALSTQYFLAQAGREILDEANVVRSVLGKLNQDVLCQLGPVDPNSLAIESAPAPTDSTASTDSEAAPAPSTMESSVSDNAVNFNIGVQGDSTRLTLTVSRMPRDLVRAGPGVCDLRRVTYWLVSSGEQIQGLARQEVTAITGAEAENVPPDIADAGSYVVAPQVIGFAVEYYDGVSWLASWNSNDTDPTSLAPVGPPAAIAVTLKIAQPTRSSPGTPSQAPQETTYRHVVAIPAANSFVASSSGMAMMP